MIGIYKIENTLNHKVYIGQSVHIERRWKEHCYPSCNSVIGKAIKQDGKENFTFQVLKECDVEQLDELELFYIKKFNSIVPNGYNVTDYIDGKPTSYIYYDQEILNNIVNDLKENKLTILEISEKYDLVKSTVYRINNGEIHANPNLTYPIRIVDGSNKHHKGGRKSGESDKNYCKECGAEITRAANLCKQCYALSHRKVDRPIREELKELIRKYPFIKIGEIYGVTDNAVRKWCKGYDLPFKVSEIKKLSEEEWEQI